MRKLLYVVLAVFMISVAHQAEAQMSRRNIKKNNKRISSFRGRKAWFAKEKVYNAIGFSVSA